MINKITFDILNYLDRYKDKVILYNHVVDDLADYLDAHSMENYSREIERLISDGYIEQYSDENVINYISSILNLPALSRQAGGTLRDKFKINIKAIRLSPFKGHWLLYSLSKMKENH